MQNAEQKTGKYWNAAQCSAFTLIHRADHFDCVSPGAIRFTHLAQPCLWFDESMVFWRTCGTYGQLLDCLRTDGFVPLHYSLIWVLSRFFHPTPFMLRFVPALSGTLMVPAIYFLARQLVRPAIACYWTAAFAACSGLPAFLFA